MLALSRRDGPRADGRTRPATIAKPAAPARDLGWLAAPIREEPSPAITSLKGVGTANAMAEARMTAEGPDGVLLGERASTTRAWRHCVQKQSEFANKVFRATADCTAGRITTSGD